MFTYAPSSRARLSFSAGLVAASLLLLLASLVTGVQAEQNQRSAIVLTIEGAIGPATMDYVARAIEQAEQEQAALLVIRMDTPGGLMESMRMIIRDILGSSVPVATYVTPAGARAASAGTYILYGSHIAAMTPATHLGSATPVQMGGMPGTDNPEPAPDADAEADADADADESEDKPRRGSSAMERKVLEDSVAYIRSLAERHGRNADWAEEAVREAVNLSAQQALERNVVDVVATDVNDLLQQINGRNVVMASGDQILETANLLIKQVDPNWRTRLLSVITNPNIAFLLMIIGFYGIIFELSNPGELFPGILGAVCLILALFAFQVLSVNYAGLALIMLGLALIIAEAFAPSFGILGVSGTLAFIFGSVILMDGTHQQVSLPMIGGIAAVAAGFMLWTLTRVVSLRHQPAISGIDKMVGQDAVAADDFQPWTDATQGRYRGHVQVSGERWNAVADQPVHAGQPVLIEKVEGLLLHLKPTNDKRDP
ncbi:nodulation protein NfeD [Halopseudomonas pelagia]|uniref:NfeD family protein n=1 Tax=Halopseudomonas pelagia TaxID=553151 RepID=UPI0030D85481